MTITNFLNKIKSEKYVQKITDAIHDAIEQTYEDATKEGNANMEVSAARGTHSTLKGRLDKTDDEVENTTRQLAQTDAKKINRNENESITKAMLSQEIKNELNNGEIEFKLNTSEIEDRAITLGKLNNDTLDFINTNSLEADGFTFERGSINSTTGAFVTGVDTRVATRNFIHLEKGILTVPDFNEMKVMVIKYPEPNQSSYSTTGGFNSGWVNQDYVTNSEGYYRFAIAYADDRIISEDEVSAIGSLLTINIPLTTNSVKRIANDSVIEHLYGLEVTGWDEQFEIGSIQSSSGRNAPTNNRIRSVSYSMVNKGIIRKKHNSPYKFSVYKYHDEEDTAYAGIDSWSDWLYDSHEINEAGYYRIVIAREDDRPIEQSEITGIVENFSLVSAGFASKNDIERIESKLQVLHGTIDRPNVSDLDFVLGSRNTVTGDRTSTTTRIVVDDLLLVPNSTVELAPVDGTKAMLFRYDYNKNYISNTEWLTKATNVNITDDTYYISLLFAFVDDREILEEDIPFLTTGLKNIVPFTASNSSGGGYYFRGGQVPAIPVNSEALGYNDFINQTWEPLRQANEDYIKREVVIKDTSGAFDIYEYTFTPEHYERTVFLVTGIHGDEYEANWGLYYFMKYIMEESHNYERLRDLKYNTRFVVIPILSPWGVENRTRATSRIGNANNNYDVFHRSPEYEDPAGAYAFSENEALAVKLVADKYNAEFDFFADFHTDRYNPEYGNYILTNQLSSTYNTAKELTLDEIAYLEQEFGFITTPRTSDYVGTNRRSSSFKYMEAVRGVPSAILEVGTGRLSPIGSSLTMTVGVDWFTNIITEMLKQDLTQPKQPKNALEQSILENRLSGYSHSVARKIPDENLQVFLDIDGFAETDWENKAERANVSLTGFDSSSKTTNGIVFNDNAVTVSNSLFENFTLLLKATITGEGRLVGSNGDLNLIIENSSEPGRYNISNGSGLLYCSALTYNEEVSIGIKSENNTLSLYVNGEPFNSVSADHSLVEELYIGATSGGVKMNLDSLALYNRPLENEEIGFVFKSLTSIE